MYGVLEGNSAKSEGGQARMLFICNAYRPGEESVGERIRLAWEDTQGDDAEFESFGLMYDSLEAPPHAPLDQGIGSREQGLVAGLRFDHVAQVTDVVDQHLHRLVAPGAH